MERHDRAGSQVTINVQSLLSQTQLSPDVKETVICERPLSAKTGVRGGVGRGGSFYSRSDLACRTTLAWPGRLQCKNWGDAGGARRAGRSRTPSPSVAESWRGFSNNFLKINLQLKYLESIISTANCFLLFMKFSFIISNTHLYLMNAASCSIGNRKDITIRRLF